MKRERDVGKEKERSQQAVVEETATKRIILNIILSVAYHKKVIIRTGTGLV